MDDGLEVECDVELAIHRAPLNELVFEVDPELQVTAVRLGNLDVNWVAAASEDGTIADGPRAVRRATDGRSSHVAAVCGGAVAYGRIVAPADVATAKRVLASRHDVPGCA